jgi:hypothetical protein
MRRSRQTVVSLNGYPQVSGANKPITPEILVCPAVRFLWRRGSMTGLKTIVVIGSILT